MEESSEQWKMNLKDAKKIAIGAAMAFGAAFAVAVIDWIAMGQFDWVLFKTVCLPAALSVGINALRKWFAGPQPI
jgi:hypothetical protein